MKMNKLSTAFSRLFLSRFSLLSITGALLFAAPLGAPTTAYGETNAVACPKGFSFSNFIPGRCFSDAVDGVCPSGKKFFKDNKGVQDTCGAASSFYDDKVSCPAKTIGGKSFAAREAQLQIIAGRDSCRYEASALKYGSCKVGYHAKNSTPGKCEREAVVPRCPATLVTSYDCRSILAIKPEDCRAPFEIVSYNFRKVCTKKVDWTKGVKADSYSRPLVKAYDHLK